MQGQGRLLITIVYLYLLTESASAHHFLHYAPEDVPYGKKSACYMSKSNLRVGVLTKSYRVR